MRLAAAALLALGGCAAGSLLDRAKPLVRGEEPVVAGTLAGGPWLVEDLNGGGMIAAARLELTFAGNAVTGRSGCNRFGGPWQQQGATINAGPLSVTRMACAPALMVLEGKFLAALQAARTVAFDAGGAAWLKTPDGRVIKLRRDRP